MAKTGPYVSLANTNEVAVDIAVEEINRKGGVGGNKLKVVRHRLGSHRSQGRNCRYRTLSKQLCGKPIGQELWRYEEVERHWDDITMRAWATIDGERVLYQESLLSVLRTPRDLMERLPDGPSLESGWAMYCGTPGAIGGIRPASRFEMEISDPVLERTLSHAYDIEVLSVVS